MPLPARLHLPVVTFAALLISQLGVAAGPAFADPAPGFVEHWAGTTLSGWGGGDFYSNPGTGGVLGAGDGYLVMTTPGPSPFFTTHLGTTSSGLAYSGNWKAAGITRVQFWLDDVGNPDPIEIHFGLGSSTNFWQYDTGFVPPAGSWGQFTVTLDNGSGWTQTIASPGGTFDAAIQNVTQVLIRHDRAPFVQTPDTLRADVGVDELTLIADATNGVPLAGPVRDRPVSLAPPYPNPSRGAVVLSMESFDGSAIRIEVVDASGRLIRRTVLERGTPGPRLWAWDGRTDGGTLAPPGSYRVRAFGAAGGTSRPLVRLGSPR
jgi:hypothetical protein